MLTFICVFIWLLHTVTACKLNEMWSRSGDGIYAAKSFCLFRDQDLYPQRIVLPANRVQNGVAAAILRDRTGLAARWLFNFGQGLPFFRQAGSLTILTNAFLIAVCSDLYDRPTQMKLTEPGKEQCIELKKKVVDHCTTRQKDVLNKQQCESLFELIENLGMYQTNKLSKSQRSSIIFATVVTLDLNNIKRWWNGEEAEEEVEDETEENVGAGGAGGTRGGDTSRGGQYTMISDHIVEVPLNHVKNIKIDIGKLLRASQLAMEKCRIEKRNQPRDCRNQVASVTAPFMTRNDWTNVFPVNYWIFTDGRKHFVRSGLCYPEDREMYPLSIFTSIRSPKCSKLLPTAQQCTYPQLKEETTPYWYKYATASSMITVDVKDVHGNTMAYEV